MIWIARDRTGTAQEAALGRGEPCAATLTAWRARGWTWAPETPEAWTETRPALSLFHRPPAAPPRGRGAS